MQLLKILFLFLTSLFACEEPHGIISTKDEKSDIIRNIYKNVTEHPEGKTILVSDDDGKIEGSIHIPHKRFRTGSREVALMDVTAYTHEFALSNSRATTNYASVGLLDINEQDIVNTRILTVKSQAIPRPVPPPRREADG